MTNDWARKPKSLEVTPQKFHTINSRFFSAFKNNRDKRVMCVYGGAGSGKSVSVAQWFCMLLVQGKKGRRAVIRKTFPSLKNSAYLLIKDILNDWNIPYKENKTDHFIEYKDNRIDFIALDDPEKVKSAEFNDIWVEEATDLNKEDYMQLKLRLNRTEKYSQLFLTFNPIDQNHWIVQDVLYSGDPDTYVHHSNWEDNKKFLGQPFIDELQNLAEKDENFYRIYCMGEPGVLQNKIYSNNYYEIPEREWPQGYHQGTHSYGLDFGYNNPMAMVEVYYYDGEYYIREKLYRSNMTTEDLIEWMKEAGISRKDEIYCDSAEPDRIEQLCRAGFNAHPAKKDVSSGIDYVKGQKIHVDATCSENLKKEDQNYKYKEDKNGNPLDEPVKYADHLEDAKRYAIYTMPISQPSAVSGRGKVQKPSFRGFRTKRPTF